MKYITNLVNKNGTSTKNLKLCELQYYLLKYIHDINEIFDNSMELLDIY